MIEYYYKFFKKNYNSKILDLIEDLNKLFKLYNINITNEETIVLSIKLKSKIKDKDWLMINKQYNTLYLYKELPSILEKFINKKATNINKKYKFIDTFAGCGGLSLGLEGVGFNCTLVNEIEPKFLETYYFNHNLDLNNYYCGDIKDLVTIYKDDKSHVKDIDLVVGGPPCQGFSMANRQRLLDDPRNKLYKYYLEMLSIIHPKFFIMENVKGMINKSDEIIDNFHEILGDDYSIKMILLNAKDFGIPQNRERVIVIGSHDFNNVTAEQIVEDILKEKLNSSNFVLNDAIGNLPELKPKRIKNQRKIENDDIGYKFRKFATKNNAYTNFINNKSHNYVFNHLNRYNNDRDIEIFNRLPQGENSLHHSISDIMPYSDRNHMFKDKYFKLNSKTVSKTITAHMKFDCNMYIHPTQARGLSAREAARIQTFPDDYVFMGANNIWYAQIGNAVPVKLAEIIGKNIMKYLK